MTTLSILGVLFLIELALVATGLAVYLYLQLKRVKLKLSQSKNQDSEEGEAPSLHDLLELQITRTRKKIAERISGESEDEAEKLSTLLNQRIEYLQIEKEVLDQHVTDQSYWRKLCDKIASVVSITPADTPAEAENSNMDEAAYKRRIANYQQQLSELHEEFNNYRKYSKRLAAGLSNYNKDEEEDKALKELMADFKDHDERLHAQLNRLQEENEKLHDNLTDAERREYAREYQARKAAHEGEVELGVNTASEEEIKRLRDIIGRQYSSLDELRASLQGGDAGTVNPDQVNDKLQAVESSQQELQTCIEVLEMENQRLMDELESARNTSTVETAENTPPEELYELRLQSKEMGDQINSLNTLISEKDSKIKELEDDYDNLQKEFMQMYAQQGK